MDDRQVIALKTIRDAIVVPRPRFWLPGKVTPDSALDAAIAVLGEADPGETIPELAPLLWRSDRRLKGRLSRLILGLASAVPPGAWPRTDEWIRIRLLALDSQAVPAPDFDSNPAMALVGLCHPSGWIREQAIAHAETMPPLIAVSLLLVRVNDWAKPVRYRAELKLSPILRQLTPGEKMALVPLLERLRHCGRHDKAAALDAWRTSLVTPFDEAAWLESWRRAGGRDRRIYLEILKQAGGESGMAVRQALLASNDRMALLWYLTGILPKLEGAERDEAAVAISRSRAVPVRREWLAHLVASRRDDAIPALAGALTDRSRSLRHFARYHLERLAPRDFAAHYRDALGKPGLEAVALRGLTEVAPSEGHPESVRRLSSCVPAVRKAAIESLNSEHLGDHLARLLEMACERVPGVSAAARRRLVEIAPALGEHLLANRQLVAELPDDLQVHLIRLSPFFSKWQGLEFLLARSMTGETRDEVTDAMKVWRRREGRSFVNLKEAPKKRLLGMLAEAGLPDDLSANLEFTLRAAE